MRSTLAVVIGLVLGLAFGLTAAASGSPSLVRAATAIEPLGTAFVNLIRMVVVPLVASMVFTGVARLGDIRALGKMGGLTLVFFWITTLVAIVIGMVAMSMALPMAPVIAPPGDVTQEITRLPGTIDFLLSLIPVNPIAAAASGQLLPLIFFVAFFGAAAGTLAADTRDRLIGLADAVSQAMVRVMHWILFVAPIGVFALAASLTARTGWGMLQSLAVFIGAVLAGLVAFYFLVYVPAVRILGGVPIPKFLKACGAPIALAFSTTSSAASLPALFDSAAQLKISPNVAGFVLSLGAAVNRAGSALFQGAAIVFLARVYGVEVSIAALASAVFATLLISQTVASVPSAGVMTLAPMLSSLGIPLSALALLLGVDRIPDMARTATQVTGHLAAACVVDKLTAGTVSASEAPRSPS